MGETGRPRPSYTFVGPTRSPLPERAVDLRTFLPTLIIGGGFALVGSVLYGAWLLGRYHGRDENGPAVRRRPQPPAKLVGRYRRAS